MDSEDLTDEDRDVLGEQVLDIYLNDRARWRGVPGATWDYKIGGFQVLRKWLSYRDKRVLGRDLTTAEARTFTNIARRLTALALLGPKLDTNYLRVTDPGSMER
ncbi:MAG: type ISP restriction/modification enzyme [Micromonosporaceae bacterium]